MKTEALIALTGLFITAGTTQAAFGSQEVTDFFSTGKNWTNIIHNPYGEEEDQNAILYKTSVIGDTLVNGTEAVKLMRVQPDAGSSRILIAREEKGVIYAYGEQSGTFEPFLDFSVSKGDSIQRIKDGTYADEYLDVLDINYMDIRGRKRKVIKIGRKRTNEIFTYWIEGIGSTRDVYIPIDTEEKPISVIDELESCYEDGECIYSIDDLKDIVAETGMFREDLRWNYWIGSSSMGRLPTITSIRYDGTMEYGGFTYHRLVNNYVLDSYGEEASFGRIYRVESGKPVLVRKAGAKIYARLPKNATGYWQEGEEDYAKEYQLVDFDCKAGESFKGLSDIGIIDVEVVRVDNVMIDGKESRALVVKPHYPEYGSQTVEKCSASTAVPVTEEDNETRIIEGVGIVGQYGFSYIFQFEILSGSPALKKVLGWNFGLTSNFYSMTDSSGNVIYPEREPNETDKAIFGSEPERVWEYATVQEQPAGKSGESVTKYTLSSYWFDGLERRGDRIYKKLCLKGEKTWTVTDKGNGVTECSPVEEVDKDECVGLFREWGGNLYMLPEEKEVSYTRYPYSDFSKRPMEEGEEITLYPLGIQSGNEADAWFDGYLANVAIGGKRKCPDNESLTEVEITSAMSQNSLSEGGNAGTGIVFGKKYVSGVGNTGLGTFWNPKPNDDPAQYKMYEPRTFFNNLNAKKWWTGEWELLYKGADISPTNPGAVGGIAADNVNGNAPGAVYDLCGRKVLTGVAESDLRSLPKGIYIYKGRKIII